MPPTSDIPGPLRPFIAHGVDLSLTDPTEAVGECPFCGKRKFYVGLVDKDSKHFAGGWSCHHCAEGGNPTKFLQMLWASSVLNTTDHDYSELEGKRGVPAAHLRAYGLCKGLLTGEWIVPGYGVGGTIVNLYRWRGVGGGKNALMPTPGGGLDIHHGYFRPTEFPAHYDTTDVVEGVWDAAAWRWALSESPRGLTTLIVAAPGCNVWEPGWCGLGAGKIVTVGYDNDHPRVNPKSQKVTQPGWTGTRRVCVLFSQYADPPRELRCLSWGDAGLGYDPTLPDGYDLRDVVTSHNGTSVAFVDERVKSPPEEWFNPASSTTTGAHSGGSSSSKNRPLAPVVCRSWGELKDAWKKAIHYNDEFEQGLIFSLAIAVAVHYGDNRLWGKLVGVGSTGKSMICEGISTATKYVVSESQLNSMYSGTRTDDGKDHSFAARLRGMCWINNDADTLLKNPSRELILSQIRELYGGNGGKAYGNGIGSRSYYGMKFTVLLAGTPEIRQLDSAELGGRFLDFVFKKPDFDTRRHIAMMAMRRQQGGGAGLAPELKLAAQMTGGYVEHLRSQVGDGSGVGITLTNEQMVKVHQLSEFIVTMQARPPRSQEEEMDCVQMPTRISTQLATLAVFSSVVRGREKIDLGAMDLVRRVALDTSRGRTEAIIRAIVGQGRRGLNVEEIVDVTRAPIDSEQDLVSYLARIDVLESFSDGAPSLIRRVKYRLSSEFRDTYRSVFPQSGD